MQNVTTVKVPNSLISDIDLQIKKLALTRNLLRTQLNELKLLVDDATDILCDVDEAFGALDDAQYALESAVDTLSAHI